jgi:hypothetical protein
MYVETAYYGMGLADVQAAGHLGSTGVMTTFSKINFTESIGRSLILCKYVPCIDPFICL